MNKRSLLAVAVLVACLSSGRAWAEEQLDAQFEDEVSYKLATDPCPKYEPEKQSGFLDFFFGRSVAHAQAEDWTDERRSFFDLSQVSNLEDERSAAPVKLLRESCLSFLKTEDLLTPDRFHKHYMQQLFEGMSYVSYLLRHHNPHKSRYIIPVMFSDEKSVASLQEQRFALSQAMLTIQGDKLKSTAEKRALDFLAPEKRSSTALRTIQAKGQAVQRANVLDVYGFMSNNNLSFIGDHYYKDGPCKGMGAIEADLKGLCSTFEGQQGLVLTTPLDPAVQRRGIYDGPITNLPHNELKPYLFPKSVIEGLRLVGFVSSLGSTKFKDGKEVNSPVFGKTLFTFDQHLYSTETRKLLQPGMSLAELGGEHCSLVAQEQCGIHFIGPHVNSLLSQYNDSLSNFALNQRATLPDSSAWQRAATALHLINEDAGLESSAEALALSAEVNAEAEPSSKEASDPLVKDPHQIEEDQTFYPNKRYPLYGIPVFFNERGVPNVGLRNTLLSYGDFKNYSYLTELEMCMLADLGYDIDPHEFYGTSVYSMGKPQELVRRYLWRNFGRYNAEKQTWDKKIPSIVPGAVGVHVYGSYNYVTESAFLRLAGYGSLGIRVDGSGNIIRQTPRSVIEVKGEDSVGLAFTYGKNNEANLGGLIRATGPKGIAVKVDFGSNALSDLTEYRGSYTRVRSLDYINGRLSKNEAQAVPLLDDLNGPQVTALNISGQLEGKRAAIFIDQSSFVKDINLSASADIKGGIFSLWHPIWDGKDRVFLRYDDHFKERLNAVIQHPKQHVYESLRRFIEKELTTNINLGVQFDNKQRLINRNYGRPLADKNAHLAIHGDISGNRLKVRQFGGSTTIYGIVRAHSLDVIDGVLSLKSTEPDGSIYQSRKLRLRSGTVLDMVDGKASRLYVQEDVKLGRNAIVRLDVDDEGNLLDTITCLGRTKVADYQTSVEPAVPYETLRRLGADPKAMLAFVTNFVKQINDAMAGDSVTTRMPRYIWDSSSDYGREIKCTARGCRIGNFVSDKKVSNFSTLEPWRYYLSFGGIAFFLICFIGYYQWRRFMWRRHH